MMLRENKPWAASPITAELFTIPLEDAYLIYAPLQQAAFIGNPAVVNQIADLHDGRFDRAQPGAAELLDFLRRLGIVDGDEHPPITTFAGVPKPTTVTLFLTTACNLRCTYCYASAGDTPTRVMPLEIAREGIDFVVRNALETQAPAIEVAYHGGGEPSVNWSTLTESYAYAFQRAQANGLELRTALATNGVLRDDRIDWIVEHLDGASVSCDGLPAVHDRHRLTVLGQGSAAAVQHTLERFDAADFNYGVRMTVTREHIPHMEASVRYLCAHFRPQRIQIEPAYQLGRWREAPSAETEGFIAGFRAAQAAAREYGHEIGFSGARLGLLGNHFCGVTQDNFCLTADGSVSGCYEVFLEENEQAATFLYGARTPRGDGFEFHLPVLNQLRRQSVDQRPFCQGCFAKWSCGGDCYHKSLVVNGPGEFQGSDRCHIIRELTKDQIVEAITRSGGWFWHAPAASTAAAQGKEMLL